MVNGTLFFDKYSSFKKSKAFHFLDIFNKI